MTNAGDSDEWKTSFPISLTQAASFFDLLAAQSGCAMLTAANWRSNEEPRESGWFEELTADEVLDEDFLTLFFGAEFVVWIR